MSRVEKRELPSVLCIGHDSVASQLCHDNIRIRNEQRTAAGAIQGDANSKLKKYPQQHLCSFFDKTIVNNPCNKTHRSNVDLARHEWTHVPRILWPLRCEHCEERFNQRSHLTQHIRSIHRKLKNDHACICGHAASDPAQITRHIQTAQKKDGTSAHDWSKYNGVLGDRPKHRPKRRATTSPATTATSSPPDMAGQASLAQQPAQWHMPQQPLQQPQSHVEAEMTWLETPNVIGLDANSLPPGVRLGYDGRFYDDGLQEWVYSQELGWSCLSLMSQMEEEEINWGGPFLDLEPSSFVAEATGYGFGFI